MTSEPTEKQKGSSRDSSPGLQMLGPICFNKLEKRGHEIQLVETTK